MQRNEFIRVTTLAFSGLMFRTYGASIIDVGSRQFILDDKSIRTGVAVVRAITHQPPATF